MIYSLDGTASNQAFPDVEQAVRYPDGLLATGGDLSPTRLVNAYKNGIFPWYGQNQPILWWAPDPRLVLFPERLHISRSLRKTMRRGDLMPTINKAFSQVIRACSEPRHYSQDTWLVPEMIAAYEKLHSQALAHSVEVWDQGQLVGGLYGVASGMVFFGESMFSWRSDASKIALVHLVQQLAAWGYQVIDCQMRTEHLLSMGAEEIPRTQFTSILQQWTKVAGPPWPVANVVM